MDSNPVLCFSTICIFSKPLLRLAHPPKTNPTALPCDTQPTTRYPQHAFFYIGLIHPPIPPPRVRIGRGGSFHFFFYTPSLFNETLPHPLEILSPYCFKNRSPRLVFSERTQLLNKSNHEGQYLYH